jgi:hypothetical protein
MGFAWGRHLLSIPLVVAAKAADFVYEFTSEFTT